MFYRRQWQRPCFLSDRECNCLQWVSIASVTGETEESIPLLQTTLLADDTSVVV